MKIHTECIPCLVKRIIFESKQSTQDTTKHAKAIQTACRIISEQYDPSICSADLATLVHKQVYDILETDDPYKALKDHSNRVATYLIPRVKELISSSENPLKTSMLCAIIGNMMDFGIEGGSPDPSMLKHTFEELYAEGIGYDEYDHLEGFIRSAQHLMLFTDNCGEIVFDKVLCQELKHYKPTLTIDLVVKGEPVLSDATLHDAQALDFDDVVDHIYTTGCYAVGVNPRKFPKEVKDALAHTDLIVCKGMANYESFSETSYHPIAYLMRTKCRPIATSMKIPVNVNAIKMYP